MFSFKAAWNHLRICPSKVGSQSLPFWSCCINFSLLISLNCLSSDLLALLHHQHILKCNSIVFITSQYTCSLRFVYGILKKKQSKKKRACNHTGFITPPLETHPFFSIKVRILLVRTFSESECIQHSAVDSCHRIQQAKISCWLVVWCFLWCAWLTLQPEFSSFLLTLLVQSLEWGNYINILI